MASNHPDTSCDGEISDSESKVETPKRSRSSGVSRTLYDRQMRFGGVIEDWRECMRDDEASEWAYEERLRRAESRASLANDNEPSTSEPQAMSTQRQDNPYSRENIREVPLGGENRASTNVPSWFRNTSTSTSSKMFKVETFPKAVKPTEQLQEWTLWLSNFEMASEKAGVLEQRARAIDLSLHIGEEMRRLIVGKGMMPPERSVSHAFPFYDNLVQSLEEHFRSLTDESVDVTTFNNLKQGDKETALEFEFRLMQVAKRVNETNAAMIRTRYLNGLRDKDLRERAFVDGIPLQAIVRMATRKEAIASKQPEFSPWGGDPVMVATVAQPEPHREQLDQRPRGEVNREWSDNRPKLRKVQAGRSNDFRQHDDRRAQGSDYSRKCPKCGISQHKYGQCPAEKAICFGCGGTGHFRHKCPKHVAAIEDSFESDKVRQ